MLYRLYRSTDYTSSLIIVALLKDRRASVILRPRSANTIIESSELFHQLFKDIFINEYGPIESMTVSTC